MKRLSSVIILAIVAIMALVSSAQNRRHVTPVNNAATRTQYVNDTRGDSARALERRRARSIHYHDDNGNTIMVDTITGQEWIDSTLMPPPPPMKYPLLYAIEAGVNVWDPIMRIFGQKYGLIDFGVALNMHNRYMPAFEVGIGTASNHPNNHPYTYRSPVAPFFRIGADYNFLYNSNPDYKLMAGVRYGFSPFSYSVTGATVDNSYWDQSSTFDIPATHATAGWFDIGLSLRVRLVSNLSAGWSISYHTILHQSHPAAGDPWYIPGYGTATSSLSAAIRLTWTINLGRKTPTAATNANTISINPENE